MCKRFYVNTVKSIVNNDIRHIAGNVHTVNGDAVLLSGSYYAIAATGTPKNAPEPHNEDRAQHAYNLHFDVARVSCTKQLETPDFKALQFYERTERKAKTRRPFNFGAGMPAVNPKFLLNILEMDHAAKIYYCKPNAILYIVGDGFEAVLMPITKPKDRPDIATDLTEYGAEPETVTPWYLRDDANGDATPIPWDVYTAAQAEPETEPEPEKPEARTSKAAEIVEYTADIAEIIEKYKRNGWKNPTFTRIAPNQYKLNGDCPLVVNRQGDRLYYDIPAAPVKASNWFDKIKIVRVGA